MSSSGNFTFLVEHSPLLADLGATAERLFPFDPAICVLKLRLLAEAICGELMTSDPADEPAAELLKRLKSTEADQLAAARPRRRAAAART